MSRLFVSRFHVAECARARADHRSAKSTRRALRRPVVPLVKKQQRRPGRTLKRYFTRSLRRIPHCSSARSVARKSYFAGKLAATLTNNGTSGLFFRFVATAARVGATRHDATQCEEASNKFQSPHTPRRPRVSVNSRARVISHPPCAMRSRERQKNKQDPGFH